MKQIILKGTVVLIMGSWTAFALGARTSRDQTCKHEWKAGFESSEFVAEECDDASPKGTKASFTSENLIPGGLQNLLLH